MKNLNNRILAMPFEKDVTNTPSAPITAIKML
jgi:hypothetical protein